MRLQCKTLRLGRICRRSGEQISTRGEIQTLRVPSRQYQNFATTGIVGRPCSRPPVLPAHSTALGSPHLQAYIPRLQKYHCRDRATLSTRVPGLAHVRVARFSYLVGKLLLLAPHATVSKLRRKTARRHLGRIPCPDRVRRRHLHGHRQTHLDCHLQNMTGVHFSTQMLRGAPSHHLVCSLMQAPIRQSMSPALVTSIPTQRLAIVAFPIPKTMALLPRAHQ